MRLRRQVARHDEEIGHLGRRVDALCKLHPESALTDAEITTLQAANEKLRGEIEAYHRLVDGLLLHAMTAEPAGYVCWMESPTTDFAIFTVEHEDAVKAFGRLLRNNPDTAKLGMVFPMTVRVQTEPAETTV